MSQIELKNFDVEEEVNTKLKINEKKPDNYGTMPYLQSIIDENGLKTIHVLIALGGCLLYFSYGSQIYALNLLFPDLYYTLGLNGFKYQIFNNGFPVGNFLGCLIIGLLAAFRTRVIFINILSVTFVISSFGILLCENWFYMSMCRIITGFSVGGSIFLYILTVSEFSPSDKRMHLVSLITLFYRVGIIFYVAFFNIMLKENNLTTDRINYQYSIALTSLSTIFYMIFNFIILRETHRYLFSINKTAEATEVLKSVIESRVDIDVNQLNIEAQDFIDVHKENSYSSLFTDKYRLTTWLISIIFALCSLNKTANTYMIPLLYRNSLNSNVIFVIIFQQSLGIMGALFGVIISSKEYFGRKFTIFSTFIFTSIITICSLIIPHGIMMGSSFNNFFYVMVMSVIKVYATEFYPTNLRNMGFAFMMVVGHFAEMLSQPLSDLFIYVNINPMILFLITCPIAAVASVMLPFDTTKNLIDHIY